jgi:formate hydrogenlyase transcriptional activator
MFVGPKATAQQFIGREPVYVNDFLWDGCRDLVLPYGIRAAWSRPLFSSEGKVLGTFAILYCEVRSLL